MPLTSRAIQTRWAKGHKLFAKNVIFEGAGVEWLRAVKKASPLARKLGLRDSLLLNVLLRGCMSVLVVGVLVVFGVASFCTTRKTKVLAQILDKKTFV